MPVRDDNPVDADFAERLAVYDEALQAGAAAPHEGTPVPPGLRSRLERAQACLRRLQQEWRDPEPARPLSLDLGSSGGQLGRFQVLRPLGRGGQGIVYLAWDPSLRRQVAVKVARPEMLADSDLHARFRREAEAAAGLDHPNLVPVYEVAEAGPLLYIVSAYCNGPNLAAWLRAQRAPVPVPVAVRLVADLAQAVQYMHDRGVLHRDIKPSNVLLVNGRVLSADGTESNPPYPSRLTPHDLPFTPKLTDFGLAKVANDTLYHTQIGAVLGTPAYMSPEQASGVAGEVGPTTDVYALGVLLYELLTGQPPFRAESTAALLQQVVSEEPVSPRRLRSGLSRDLETICLKCLTKEPRQRYLRAGDLTDDLHRFSHGSPIRARPVGIVVRAWRRGRRHPAAVGLAAAVVLLLALASTSTFRPPPAPVAEAAPAEDLDEENYVRSVANAQRSLAEGRPVVLIDPQTRNLAYRWRAGPGTVRFREGPPGPGPVVIASMVPALFEVLPALPCPAYRVRLEMRQEEFFSAFGDQGLYFAHQQHLTSEGPQHFFGKASFADLGPSAQAPQDGLQGPGSRFQLQLWHQGTSTTRPFRSSFSQGPVIAYVPGNPRKGPGEWRTFHVDVLPDNIRASWSGRTLDFPPAPAFARWLAYLQQRHPDLVNADIRYSNRSAVGIYVFGVSVSVRRLIVEPLE